MQNGNGQLGDGTTNDNYNPVVVIDELGNQLEDIIHVTAGAGYTVAPNTSGGAWSWGGNWYGGLGDGTIIDRHNPVVVKDVAGNIFVGLSADP